MLMVSTSKWISVLLVFSLLAGCSSTGGIYKENDPQNNEFSIGRTLLSVIAVAGVVAAARSGGGGNGYAQENNTVDYDWAWDEFYNQYRQLIWACRGKQTGQFATLDKCAYKPKIDNTWPSKSAN